MCIVAVYCCAVLFCIWCHRLDRLVSVKPFYVRYTLAIKNVHNYTKLTVFLSRSRSKIHIYTENCMHLSIYYVYFHQITFLAILFLSFVCSSIFSSFIFFLLFCCVYQSLCCFLYFLSFARAAEREKMQGGAIYTVQHSTAWHNTNEQTIYILYSIFVHNHILQFVWEFSFIFHFFASSFCLCVCVCWLMPKP